MQISITRKASEWLPVVALVAAAAVYLLAPAGSTARNLALAIGCGLVPGTVCWLAGRSSWTVHRVCFAASLIAFVFSNPNLRPGREEWNKILANPGWIALGMFVSFLQPLLGALRFRLLLNDAGLGRTYSSVLRLCLTGTFFSIFLPGATGGDAYRVYALTGGRKGKIAKAIAATSLDRILGFPGLILIIFAAIVLDQRFFLESRQLSRLLPFLLGAAAACLAIVAYLAVGFSRRRAKQRREGGGEERPGNWLGRLNELVTDNVRSGWTLGFVMLFGCLSHLAAIFSCVCFGNAVGVSGIPVLRYFLLIPLAMVINAIPGAPGGLGQGELALAALLDLAAPGLGNAQAGVIVMFLFRVSTTCAGLVGGGLYMANRGGSPAPSEGQPQPNANGS